jgi:hypothetical protein
MYASRFLIMGVVDSGMFGNKQKEKILGHSKTVQEKLD